MVRTEEQPLVRRAPRTPAPRPTRRRPVAGIDRHRRTAHVEPPRPFRLSRRVKWVLLAVAAAFFTAGVVVPHALLIAAGLILAGTVGVGGSH
ncbi:hypothetical protein [Umezawaea tangerina]|uniref:Uncharacterized protein n=1 Tax=Umezawaea tangerina TaxID=84725 RepID=A0A2T0STH9_9PSEU|nr:hypothetical protein [Umezawaea tangerina]PRY36716.1 hypothetical protein CLV43_11188 [Umezawaea tangerina]